MRCSASGSTTRPPPNWSDISNSILTAHTPPTRSAAFNRHAPSPQRITAESSAATKSHSNQEWLFTSNESLRSDAPRLGQYLGRNFFQSHLKHKHRLLRSATPPVHFPMRANELHIPRLRQVQQHRRLPTVILLRETKHRLRLPCRAVDGSEDAHIE